MKAQKTIVMCLGERLQEDGTMHVEHKTRVKAAFAQYQKASSGYEPSDVVVVLTGGKTRSEYPSEALQSKRYFEMIATEAGIDADKIFVIVEDVSLTTAQNFFCTKKLCSDRGIFPDKVIAIARTSQALKARVFAFWSWPFMAVDVIKTLDTKPLWYRALDSTVLVLLAVFDPHARIRNFVEKLFRKL